MPSLCTLGPSFLPLTLRSATRGRQSASLLLFIITWGPTSTDITPIPMPNRHPPTVAAVTSLIVVPTTTKDEHWTVCLL